MAPFDEGRCIALPDSSHIVQALTEDAAAVSGRCGRSRVHRGQPARVPVRLEYGAGAGAAYRVVYPKRSFGDRRIVAWRGWLANKVS
ncbi:hypothetical protein [Burkholderia multivorans]|uniref:hypothetical protein n=1 Tax=Burkholderia multivorans TaxID=87883 RepID=UPI0011B27E7B|nr:hypothetical protein [Burkholderia multivorans]MBR8239538.1 hypothetical protein [Burkholderia multivorans]MDN7943550.1 hypothetical protein [Burkholderia multivorans]